jgi:hypothetical protein
MQKEQKENPPNLPPSPARSEQRIQTPLLFLLLLPPLLTPNLLLLLPQSLISLLLRLEREPDPDTPRHASVAFNDGVDVALFLAHFGVFGHVGFGGELGVERGEEGEGELVPVLSSIALSSAPPPSQRAVRASPSRRTKEKEREKKRRKRTSSK